MRFCYVPEAMNVGAAHLTPVGGSAALEQFTCDNCDRVSISIFLCCSQHVLCKVCCLAEPLRTSVWCPVCRRTVTADEVKFSVETLAEFQFRCACGFTSTLTSMRTHLLEKTSSDQERVCGNEVASLDRKSTKDEKDMMRVTKLDDFIDGLGHNDAFNKLLAQKMEQFKNELLKRIEGQNANLSLLKEKSKSTVKNLNTLKQAFSAHSATLKQCKAEIADKLSTDAFVPTAYLWFNFEALFKHSKESGEGARGPSQSTIVAGIHLEVSIDIENEDNQDYLGLYIKLVKGSTETSPVPLHRRFILKVHDRNGADAATSEYNSVEDGEYFFGCSTRVDSFSCDGNPKMINVKSLRKKCLVGDMICVSVGVGPMQ